MIWKRLRSARYLIEPETDRYWDLYWGKTATKSEAEREDEAVQDLIHRSPKKKPPRNDLRNREIAKEDKDLTDTREDRDLSLNYKKVASKYIQVLGERSWNGARIAFEFDSQEALDIYLDERPDADANLHWVKEEEEPESKSKKDEKENVKSVDKDKALSLVGTKLSPELSSKLSELMDDKFLESTNALFKQGQEDNKKEVRDVSSKSTDLASDLDDALDRQDESKLKCAKHLEKLLSEPDPDLAAVQGVVAFMAKLDDLVDKRSAVAEAKKKQQKDQAQNLQKSVGQKNAFASETQQKQFQRHLGKVLDSFEKRGSEQKADLDKKQAAFDSDPTPENLDALKKARASVREAQVAERNFFDTLAERKAGNVDAAKKSLFQNLSGTQTDFLAPLKKDRQLDIEPRSDKLNTSLDDFASHMADIEVTAAIVPFATGIQKVFRENASPDSVKKLILSAEASGLFQQAGSSKLKVPFAKAYEAALNSDVTVKINEISQNLGSSSPIEREQAQKELLAFEKASNNLKDVTDIESLAKAVALKRSVQQLKSPLRGVSSNLEDFKAQSVQDKAAATEKYRNVVRDNVSRFQVLTQKERDSALGEIKKALIEDGRVEKGSPRERELQAALDGLQLANIISDPKYKDDNLAWSGRSPLSGEFKTLVRAAAAQGKLEAFMPSGPDEASRLADFTSPQARSAFKDLVSSGSFKDDELESMFGNNNPHFAVDFGFLKSNNLYSRREKLDMVATTLVDRMTTMHSLAQGIVAAGSSEVFGDILPVFRAGEGDALERQDIIYEDNTLDKPIKSKSENKEPSEPEVVDDLVTEAVKKSSKVKEAREDLAKKQKTGQSCTEELKELRLAHHQSLLDFAKAHDIEPKTPMARLVSSAKTPEQLEIMLDVETKPSLTEIREKTQQEQKKQNQKAIEEAQMDDDSSDQRPSTSDRDQKNSDPSRSKTAMQNLLYLYFNERS